MNEYFKNLKKLGKHVPILDKQYEPGMVPDYNRRCIVCGAKPIVPITQMCGPCTFGEAATADGNWGITKTEER